MGSDISDADTHNWRPHYREWSPNMPARDHSGCRSISRLGMPAGPDQYKPRGPHVQMLNAVRCTQAIRIHGKLSRSGSVLRHRPTGNLAVSAAKESDPFAVAVREDGKVFQPTNKAGHEEK